MPALADDPRFRTNRDRVANYDALKPELDRALAARSTAEWTARLQAASVPCGAVRNVRDVLGDPHLAARGMVVPVTHPTAGPTHVIGTPLKLSGTPGDIRTPPPTLGQHTDAVLREVGYDEADIARLRAAGAV